MSENPWKQGYVEPSEEPQKPQPPQKPQQPQQPQKMTSSTVASFIFAAILVVMMIGEWVFSIYVRSMEAESKANAVKSVEPCKESIHPQVGISVRCTDPRARIEVVRGPLNAISAYACRCPDSPSDTGPAQPVGVATPSAPSAAPVDSASP